MELCDYIWEEGIPIKSMNNEDKIHKIVNCLKSRAYVANFEISEAGTRQSPKRKKSRNCEF